MLHKNEDKKVSANKHFKTYKSLWDKHADKDLLERILVLLRDYADTFSLGIHHRDAIKKILKDYEGKNGYLNHHCNTPVCNPVFLLLQIPLHIDTLDSTGRLAAILEVIKIETGIDVFTFFQETEPFYLALKQDKNSVIEKMLQCMNFPHFMLKNPEIFLPHTTKEETFFSHFINLDSLKKRFSKYGAQARLAYMFNNITTQKTDLINFLLNFNRNDIIIANEIHEIMDHTVEHLAKKNPHYLISLFESALNNAPQDRIYYKVATYLFFKIHHMKFPKEHDDIDYLLQMIEEICSEVYSSKHSTPLNNKLFLKIIDHAIDYYNNNKKETSYFNFKFKYILMKIYSINNLIKDFHEIDNTISKKLDIEFDQLFLTAIKNYDLTTIEYILRKKQIDLKKTFISHNPEANIKYPDITSFDDQTSIKMNLIQAMLFMVSTERKLKINNLATILNIIQLCISHTPDSIIQPDSMGNSIIYYLRMLIKKKSECITSNELIDRISGLICQTYCFHNMIPFILSIKRSEFIKEIFPDELFAHIFFMQLYALNDTSKKEIGYHKLHPAASITFDEAVELFENQLEQSKYSDAINTFCIANQIQDDILDMSVWNQLVLNWLCNLTKKPTNAVFFLKLLDHLSQAEFQYKIKDLPSCYIRLLNISHLINDWETVKNKFHHHFPLGSFINKNINLALDHPESPAISHLLEEKKLQIKKDGLAMTPLQAMILEIKDPHSTYGYGALDESLTILHNIIEKMFSYDKTYLTECDDAGHDIFHFLNHLKNSLHREYHEKIDTIINLVHEQKKECLFRANAGLLFFHPESVYSTVPRDVVAEVASLSSMGIKK